MNGLLVALAFLSVEMNKLAHKNKTQQWKQHPAACEWTADHTALTNSVEVLAPCHAA
jgi:hypothetical protein